jgi:transposase
VFSGLFYVFAWYICRVNETDNISASATPDMITIPLAEYEAMLSINARQGEQINEFKIKFLSLQHQLAQLTRLVYGSKSERFLPTDKAQMAMELEDTENPAPAPITETITYTRKKNVQDEKQGHSRVELPAHLPREVTVIEPDHDVTGWKKIGEESSEYLAHRRGSWYVKRIVRPKYANPSGEGVVIGKLPLMPIHKGNALACVIAYIIICKFTDHLPWYRQAQMIKRDGIVISESTMIGWFKAACKLLEPLYDLHKAMLLLSRYIQADETPIRVLSRDVPGATHKGYFWVYFDPITRNVVFEYRPGRGQSGPMEFLKDFKGSLQTDGYAAYDVFGRDKEIALLACFAHTRRKFDESKSNDKDRSEHMLGLIQKLYAIERETKTLEHDFDAIRDLRQKESLPILIEMEAWLKKSLIETLPKSAIGGAIAYSLNLWPRLIRYIEDGRYQIDNNLIENSIRPIVIGRRNYLFAGSHEAAQRAAMIYSFVGTCKQLQIDPSLWLENVLERLPYFKKNDDLSILLPGNWKKEQDARTATEGQ